MNESEQPVKSVYVKPIVLPMEDVFTQIIPFSRSFCYTSSGR